MPYGKPGLFRTFADPANNQTNSAGPNSAGENAFGSDGVFLGFEAGSDVGVDPTNAVDGAVIIGAGAGRNVQADEIIIIGRDAAPDLANAGDNAGSIVIGARALAALSSSAAGVGGHTIIGFEAMELLADADTRNNTVLGYQAGSLLSGGGNPSRDNVLIGFQAGQNDQGVNGAINSIAIGSRAGQGSASFRDSIYIGASAGRVNTGLQNICIGSDAGETGTGNNNVFIGHNAADTPGGGSNNVAIGQGAGPSTLGNNNVVLGSGAGNGSASISQTLVGFSSGGGMAGDDGGVAIGMNAGDNNIVDAQPFVIESQGDRMLYGDFNRSCLLLSNTTNRAFPRAAGPSDAGPIFALQDAAGAGGGIAPPTLGATGVCGIFYDSTAGVSGELRAIDPAGNIATLGAF